MPRTGAAARPPAWRSARTTSPARPVRASPRSRRAPSRRPTTSSAFATPQPGELPPVLDLEATGNLSARLLQAWTQGVDAGGLRPPRCPSRRLLVTGVLAGASRRLDVGRGGRDAALDRALDDREQTVDPRPELERPRLDVLAVDQLRLRARHRPLHRRRPDERSELPRRSRSRRTRPTRRRSPPPPSIVGTPEAGKLLSAVPGVWDGGKPLSFTYQWRQCDAAGANCVDIAGATREKYRRRPAMSDTPSRVRVDGGDRDSATAEGDRARRRSPSLRPAPRRPRVPRTSECRSCTEHSRSARSSRARPAPGRARRRSSRTAGSAATRAVSAVPRSRRRTHARTRRRPTISARRSQSSSRPRVPAAPLRRPRHRPASSPRHRCRRSLDRLADGRPGRRRKRRDDRRPRDRDMAAGRRPGRPHGQPRRRRPEPRPRRHRRRARPSPASRAPASSGRSRSTTRQPRPRSTVLGYSTDGQVFATRARAQLAGAAERPEGRLVSRDDGTAHVLTRTPLDLSLFTAGAWGDPTYTSPDGPEPHAGDAASHARARLRPHRPRADAALCGRADPADRDDHVADGRDRLDPAEGKRASAARCRRDRALKSVQTERDLPGAIRVRLRLNDRRLAAGTYKLRVVAVDPVGPRSVLRFRFTLS